MQMEERVDGTMRMTHKGRALVYHAITARPVKAVEAKTVHPPRCPVTPRPDHPWRLRLRPERRTQVTGDGGEHINRTCLLWEKADISKLG